MRSESGRCTAWLLATCVVGLLSGCASFVNGKTQEVRIASEPPGARAVVHPYGRQLTTPATTELERYRTYWIEVRKSGYKPQTIRLYKEWSDWTWGNAALFFLFPPWGIAGFIVDADSGANYHIRPSDIFVELVPEAVGSDPTSVSGAPAEGATPNGTSE